MVSSAGMWAFFLAKLGVVFAAGLLAGLSYLASRRNIDQPSYRFATIGFSLMVLGALVDPAYLVGIAVDFVLTGTELVILEAVEGVLLTSGLGLLFYAITRHDSSASSTADDHSTPIDETRPWKHLQWHDE